MVKGTKVAKILVVDDEIGVIDGLKTGLMVPGYLLKIFGAANGKEGLKRAREENPDLIITDMTMPYLDGFGFIKKLKSDPFFAKTKVIMLTADRSSETIWESHNLYFDDFITKPFDLSELETRIYYQLLRQAEDL